MTEIMQRRVWQVAVMVLGAPPCLGAHPSWTVEQVGARVADLLNVESPAERADVVVVLRVMGVE